MACDSLDLRAYSPILLTLGHFLHPRAPGSLSCAAGGKLRPKAQSSLPSTMDETDVERESLMFFILSTFHCFVLSCPCAVFSLQR